MRVSKSAPARCARIQQRSIEHIGIKPIRRAHVIAFLDWIGQSHPQVRSLRQLSKEEFMDLAVSFEKSKGVIISESHDLYRKWERTQCAFAESRSNNEALNRLS